MPSTVGKYDGTTDPDDHINVFISAGGVERWALHEWCHMFVQTLVGTARLWYDSLPIGRIDSFDEFVEKFMQQFNQQKRHTKDKTEILHIRRRDGESVEDFITRYNKESLQIAGAGEDLMIAGFIQGIRHDELIRRLHGRDGLPKTMEELMTAARAFVRAERSVRSTHEYDKKDQRSDRTGKQPHSSRQTQHFRGPSTWTRSLPYTRPELVRSANTSIRFKDNPESRGVAWINKLVKSPREVLLTEKLRFEPPRPLNPKSIRDPKRYCDFHKDTGHDTDHCWHLQKQIDIAIQTGKLSHLLKEIHAGPPGRKNAGKKPVRDLCMIMNEESSSTRGYKCGGARLEAWMEQPLTFPPVQGVPHPPVQ
ncbi:hypothetical protein L1987_56112 [Smallanthus sonchifolius]|uniref:Uncharacterized protein n=1 Tax=Smallanthus sonchifolius TaxID=185202 RepID=A0ACB9EBW6_9ASTR|nr:hypothetical protein L1987_56112 [Smallanthus sonchifolius]